VGHLSHKYSVHLGKIIIIKKKKKKKEEEEKPSLSKLFDLSMTDCLVCSDTKKMTEKNT
jgi:hypothetical protein